MLPSLDYPQGIISCMYTLPASGSPKTAFNTHFGKFEWRVFPMGLSNTPAVFELAMNQLISLH
jgi:hypothetical protein